VRWEVLRTLYFHRHFNGYVIELAGEVIAFKPEDLHVPWPVVLHKQKTSYQFLVCPTSMPDVDEIL